MARIYPGQQKEQQPLFWTPAKKTDTRRLRFWKDSKALPLLYEALEINRQLDSKEGQVTCLVNIGYILSNQGKYEDDLKILQESLEIIGDINPLTKAEILDRMASTYRDLGDLPEA